MVKILCHASRAGHDKKKQLTVPMPEMVSNSLCRVPGIRCTTNKQKNKSRPGPARPPPHCHTARESRLHRRRGRRSLWPSGEEVALAIGGGEVRRAPAVKGVAGRAALSGEESVAPRCRGRRRPSGRRRPAMRRIRGLHSLHHGGGGGRAPWTKRVGCRGKEVMAPATTR
jgi:hypothetical protein